MEHIKEYREFLLTEAKGKIKKYKEVEVGDIAFENPEGGGSDEIGEIVWKGTAEKLKKSTFKFALSDWESEVDDDPADFDLIVVRVPNYGDTLFNYDNDPSGAVVYKK